MNNFSNNTAVLTTKYVIEDESIIVYLSYDEDGDLQVFSKEGAEMKNAKIVTVNQILTIDSSLKEIFDEIQKGDKYFRENKQSEWKKI